jgi:hypothetical protein
MVDNTRQARPVPTNNGNPRVTVAFPFSKIEIRDPEPALADLAELVRGLTEYVATLSHELAAEHTEVADRLAEEAERLVTSLRAG